MVAGKQPDVGHEEAAKATDSEHIESNTMPAKRLKVILRRVADGTYDNLEVIDEIARRVVDDL
jgi:hypothetical protein